NDVDRNVLVGGDGLDHQKAFGVRERIRLRKMTHWITRLLFDAPRIGIRDPDENGLGARRGAAQVLEVSVVEGLEPSMNHPLRHRSSAPSIAGNRSDSSTSRTRLRSATSCACPKSPNPVTSVTACGEIPRSMSAASLLSVRIQRIARSSCIAPARPFL